MSLWEMEEEARKLDRDREKFEREKRLMPSISQKQWEKSQENGIWGYGYRKRG